MGAQDKTERVLRDIHVLFSKAEPVDGSDRKVVIDKTSMTKLLKELSDCMYAMMEEYELTEKAREKADRKQQKTNEEMIFEATRKAEDVYAAAIMYSDNTFASLAHYLTDATEGMQAIFDETKKKIEQQEQAIKESQSNFKAILNSMIDTEKYFNLIQDENARIAKEKALNGGLTEEELFDDEPVYEAAQVHVNTEFLAAAGYDVDSIDEGTGEPHPVESKEVPEEDYLEYAQESYSEYSDGYPEGIDEAALSAQLDAEYFDWQEGSESNSDKPKAKKGFGLFSKK